MADPASKQAMSTISSQRTPATAAIPVSSDSARSPFSLTENLLRLFSHIKYENLAAGLSGGVISTMVLHPLDLVKIRFAGKRVVQWHLVRQSGVGL